MCPRVHFRSHSRQKIIAAAVIQALRFGLHFFRQNMGGAAQVELRGFAFGFRQRRMRMDTERHVLGQRRAR